MIQPVNHNLNISSKGNLKPVEVPHFTGNKKTSANQGDIFVSVKNRAKTAFGKMRHYNKERKNFFKQFFKSMFGNVKKLPENVVNERISNYGEKVDMVMEKVV